MLCVCALSISIACLTLNPHFLPVCYMYVHTCICCNTCSPHRGTACEDVVYIHCTCKHTFECADSLDMYCIYRCTCTCALKHAFEMCLCVMCRYVWTCRGHKMFPYMILYIDDHVFPHVIIRYIKMRMYQ